MAGNSEKDKRKGRIAAALEYVTDTIQDVFLKDTTIVATDIKQSRRIDFCASCEQPLLTTYEECSVCHKLKKDPGTCNLPGCNKPRYFDIHTRSVFDFCGKTHAKQFKDMFQHQYQSRHFGPHRQDYHDSNIRHPHGTRHHGDHSTVSYYGNGPIHFYNHDEPYYEFTNFYEGHQPIVLDNAQWRTSEHYFQAQKFVGTPYVEWIRRLDRPREAFDLSRDPSVSQWCRNDWEQVKVNVMYKVLLAKFTQSEHLKQLLLSTGDRKLVEHTHQDSFWGDGGDGSGQNYLGRLLMKVRKEIHKRSGGLLRTDSARNSRLPVDDECQHYSDKMQSNESEVEKVTDPPVGKLIEPLANAADGKYTYCGPSPHQQEMHSTSRPTLQGMYNRQLPPQPQGMSEPDTLQGMYAGQLPPPGISSTSRPSLQGIYGPGGKPPLQEMHDASGRQPPMHMIMPDTSAQPSYVQRTYSGPPVQAIGGPQCQLKQPDNDNKETVI